MAIFFETIRIVLPVFVVIALGFLLRRMGLFDDTFTRQTNRLVYLVFLPILLFYKISQADFVTDFNGPLVVGSSLTIVCLFAISYAYGHLRKYSPASLGSFSQGSFRGNLAFVGLAICLNAYGESGLTHASILMGFLVPVLNLFAIIALILPQRHKDSDGPKQNWLHQIMLNPLIIASFSGITWSYFSLPVPIILKSSLGIVAGLTLPLALLAIGGSFSLQRLKGDLKSAGIATLFKLLGMPLVAGLLLITFGVQGVDLGIGILLAGTPTATATYIMAHQMKADGELAGSIVMLSTLVSAVSYTLLLLLLRHNGL
ncbi:MAG: AEC family transporter [Desulfuromonadaceae bacterium]|nr:AEC family transporter [Desulfuromonadaceae bacterium]